MSPSHLTQDLVRDVPLLRAGDPVERAVRVLLEHDLPALPVVEDDGRLVGIFGEREFIIAMFPRYLGQLGSAKFVPRSLDEALERRAGSRLEPVRDHANRERIAVPRDYSDAQIAETFLHHRVLIVPVVEGKRVVGAVTRGDFFRRLAERLLGA